jgi:hypothetical protein
MIFQPVMDASARSKDVVVVADAGIHGGVVATMMWHQR